MHPTVTNRVVSFACSVLSICWVAVSIHLPAVDPKPMYTLDDYRRAVSTDGAAARGSKLFLDQRSACSTCHSTDGRGGKVGPDLLGVADKLDRDGLVRAVLEPS